MSDVLHVFVYGTLRAGKSRNPVLADAKRIGGIWEVWGTMYTLGPFPALTIPGRSKVKGEVYAIPHDKEDAILAMLDGIEGVDFGLYKRTTTIATNGKDFLDCFVYTAGPELADELVPENIIPTGDWLHVEEIT